MEITLATGGGGLGAWEGGMRRRGVCDIKVVNLKAKIPYMSMG